MRAEPLIEAIESYHARFVQTNALYRLAEDGAVDAPTLQQFLAGAAFLTANTLPSLRRAMVVARQRGDVPLAAFFAQKMGEEAGHTEWAEADQQGLAQRFDLRLERELGPGVRRYIDAQNQVIEEDPALYLAYVLFAEYFTVLATPGWVELLATRCALPPEYSTVLTKHVELDKEHVAECVREFNELLQTYPRAERMWQHLRLCFELYEGFLNDIVEAHHDRRTLRSA